MFVAQVEEYGGLGEQKLNARMCVELSELKP